MKEINNNNFIFFSTGENKTVEISPSQPIYYGYTFSGQVESSSVIVHVKSDSDICMTVSIQNISVSLNFISNCHIHTCYIYIYII